MMPAYHHKLFLKLILPLMQSVYFCVNDATITHPYKWVKTELRNEKGIH